MEIRRKLPKKEMVQAGQIGVTELFAIDDDVFMRTRVPQAALLKNDPATNVYAIGLTSGAECVITPGLEVEKVSGYFWRTR